MPAARSDNLVHPIRDIPTEIARSSRPDMYVMGVLARKLARWLAKFACPPGWLMVRDSQYSRSALELETRGPMALLARGTLPDISLNVSITLDSKEPR